MNKSHDGVSLDVDPLDLGYLRRFGDHIPQLVWSCLPNGWCNYLSRRWVEYTGVAEEVHHGLGWQESLHPDDRPRVADLWQQFTKSEADYDLEYRLRRYDGVYQWFKTRGVIIRDPSGSILRIFGTCTDINDQKQTEEKLRESRERLEATLAASGTGTFRWDIITNALEWDEQLDRLFGLSPGQTVRSLEKFVERVHPDDRAGVIERCRRCKEEGADFMMEFRVVWPDGSVHWLDDRGRTFRDTEGRPSYMTGACVDLTNRKRAERTILSLLRISERLNSTLEVDALLDTLVQEAISLVDAEGGVAGLRTPDGMVCKKYFQKGTVLPLEYCWPPMHGLPGWLIVHKTPYLTNDALTDTQIIHELCVQFGVYSALSTPILSAAGEVLGFFEIHNKRAVSGFDLADRDILLAVSQIAAIAIQNALAYRNVLRAEEALKEADRRKDEFLAMLAHELRNPLAPVRNAVQILQIAGPRDTQLVQARAMIERQTGHMARLLDDLLEVSRISRGKIQIRPESTELTAIVHRAVDVTMPAATARGHDLSLAIPRGKVPVSADPTRLEQVFVNLIANAIKYTPKSGRIRVAISCEDRRAKVIVSDNGVGISSELMERMFDLFVQAEQGSDRSQGGLGIGLTLVKLLTEMHGGTVVARSDGPGHGATFTVILPLAAGDMQSDTSPSTSTGIPTERAKRRVLVVDDNRDAAESMGELLKISGHEITIAHEGRSALELAAQFRPHVVLLDIGLPTMDGYAVARELRSQFAEEKLLLIAATGYGQDEDVRRAKEAGFDHHLVKPVDPAVVISLIQSV